MGKVLVTGGCGYIGSHTAVDLMNNGYNVISIDSFVNGHQRLADGVTQITNKKYDNRCFDLTSRFMVEDFFEKEEIDHVIHFAALKSVPDSVHNPIEYYRNNIDSLLNVLEACIDYGVKTFVFSSSCSVYGNPDSLPVTEETPIKEAESPYARTKQICEQICLDVAKKHPEINIIILRYFNPAGAHESGLIGDLQIKPQNVVPIITRTAIGKMDKMMVYGSDYPTRDGSCIRDYVHVMDIANAHTKALDYVGPENYTIFNLGSGDGCTVFELINAFESTNNVKLNYEVGPRRDGDVISIYSNSEKAINELNWSPKHDINEMMRSAWLWENNQ